MQCRVASHGKLQVEIKTQYPLGEGERCRYRMALYFFFPSQLRMTSENHRLQSLLASIHSNTRFASPNISMAMLIDRECLASPLTRILGTLADPDEDKLIYELRMLVNIFRSEIGSVVRLIRQMARISSSRMEALVRVERLLTEVERFIKDFRTLKEKFIDPRITDQCRTALGWADESIGMKMERELFRLHDLYVEEGGEVFERICTLLEDEAAYQRTNASQPLEERTGERRRYRESILKKWSQGALYMEREIAKTPRKIGHFLAGIAAAVAMAFALTATIFAERLFPGRSIPWALMIVVSYIFKDRIKEVFRSILEKLVPRWVYDRGNRLIDPSTDRSAGFCKETIRFPEHSKIPPDIHVARNRTPNPFHSILPLEDVLLLHRSVTVKSRSLKEKHTRLDALVEIMRIKVLPWLGEMDSPRSNMFELQGRKKIKLDGRRVYYVNLIVKLSCGKGERMTEYFVHRLVLDRNGIVRIEERQPSIMPSSLK